MKRLAIIVLLINLAFNTQASIPEGMPQAVYDGIVAQVMTDEGHYDAILVEQAISQWLLEQPLPDSDGVLTDTGNCSECAADSQGTMAELPQPRNVKIKAKQKNNGSFTTTYKIKWKRPKALASDSPYAFSHYNVFVSKDGASYETFEVTPKIKRNGRPKKKNKIKFKDSQEGTYTVQVQAVYVESSAVINKSSNNTQQSVEYFNSGWTNQKLYSLEFGDLFVSDLSGNLKECIINAGYANNTHLKVFTKIDCRNSSLVDLDSLLDSDIAQLEDFYNLQSLIIDDNSLVTDISPLKNLPYLTLLSLEGNTSINLDFSKIVELEDLYLGRMELTSLPDLSGLTDLEYLDLSDNQIGSGFNKLPDSLTVLVLDDNLIENCDGLDGLEIETISIQGENIKNFASCSNVLGLKHLSVKDTPNITGEHSINDYSGFCSLELDNTGIKKLTGSRPIRSLTLTSNNNLKKVKVIKTGITVEPDDVYPNLIPSYVSLNGSPNIVCSNIFGIQQTWSDNDKLDMTVPVYTKVDGIEKTSLECPVINYDFIFNKEASCESNKIKDVTAVRSISKTSFSLFWGQDNHSLWGITSYEVRINHTQADEKIRILSHDLIFPIFLENTSESPSFEVRACKTNDSDSNNIIKICGNWSDSTWSPELSKVNDLSSNWISNSGNSFTLDFTYPQVITIHESNIPDYFEISSGLDISVSLIQTINYTANNNPYTSQAIDLDTLLSREFSVRACKNPYEQYPTTCGRSKLIRVKERPSISPETEWPIQAKPTISHKSINIDQGLIKFTVSSSSLARIDYFDIVETQPVAVVDGPPVSNPDNKKFYTLKAENNQASLDLIRKVNGNYYFKISACRELPSSNVERIVHCSDPLELGETNDDWKIQRTVDNPDLNKLFGEDASFMIMDWDWIDCNDSYDSNIIVLSSTNNTASGTGCIPTSISNEEDLIGGNDYIKSRIKWSYRNSGTDGDITPPDYFHLSRVITTDNGKNFKAIDSVTNPTNYHKINNLCIQKQASTYNIAEPGLSPKYAKQQLVVDNETAPAPSGSAPGFNSQKACPGGIRVSSDGRWKVKACYSGIGCTSGKEINILADVQNTENNGTFAVNGDIGDIRSHETMFDVEVEDYSPDNLQSGLWWNPHQAGTGWYFHWKNNSTNPNQELKNSSNLLAHWIIYRKFNNDTWSPIWVYADMSLDQSNDNNDQIYSGQLLYSHIVGGEKIEQGLGTIKVLINPNQDNSRAKIELDIDSDQGFLSQDSINFDFAGDEGEYFEIGFGESGDGIDSVTLPLETFGIRIIGEDPDDNSQTGGLDQDGIDQFGYKNNLDHYSGLWEYEGTSVSDDAIIAVWQKHNLEIMNFFIYDNTGEPFWLMSQTCGNPCRVPVDGYFDKYINAQTGEYEFGIVPGAPFNFNTKVDGGFNPLGYKPNEPWVEVEFLAAAGRMFADNEDTSLQGYQQAKFWLDINTNDIDTNLDDANRHVTKQLGSKPPEDGPYTSLLTMNKIANINHIGFNLKDFRGNIQFDDEHETIVSTTCDPNVTGYCTVDLNWYTDSSTNGLPLKPYYKHIDSDMEDFAPLTTGLENINCSIAPPSESFVSSYQCKDLMAGTYEFQLRRNKYSGTGYIVIAESAQLTSMACNGECNFDEDTVDDSEDPYIGPDAVGPNEGGNGDGDGVLELSDLPTAPDESSIVGTTKGNFSVSPNGSANYSIPILTAPGSGGLAPQVSINYNSQSSRSALGKGWSVSGYSAISRCGQTFAQDYDENSTDPLVLGVNFSSTDRFCVNGKRLFLKDGTSYGADGATYETEINDFTKYTSYGVDTPECFIAQHKNGSKTYYGNCSNGSGNSTGFVDSGIEAFDSNGIATGSNMALMWAQSRMVDNKDNFYDNFYHSEMVLVSNEEMVKFYLDKIKYSSNLSLSTGSGLLKGTIQLNYSLLADSQKTSSVISVFPHVKTFKNLKLDSITSSYTNEEDITETIRHYELNYGNTDAAGFDLLTSVKECSDGNADVSPTSCLTTPTSFTWGNTEISSNLNDIESSGAADIYLPPVPADKQIIAGKFDANNDGLEDFYYSSSDLIKIGLSQSDSLDFELINGPNVIGGIDPDIGIKTADINADGFPDFIYLNNIYLWQGDSDNDGIYYHAVDFSTVFGTSIYSQEFYDFNGDGLVDILNFNPSAIENGEPKLTIYTNRYDLTSNEGTIGGVHASLVAAFSHDDNPAIPIDFEVKSFYKYDVDLNPIDIFKDIRVEILDFEQITLNQVTDINNDGIPEIILEISVTLDCPANPANFSCIQTAYTNLKAIAYLNDNNSYSIQHLAGGSACTACKKQIKQERFVDVTGDGQPELCYIDLLTTSSPITTTMNGWKCHSELGDKNTTSILDLNTVVNLPTNLPTSTLDRIEFVDYQDLDGDGILDFMYSYDDKWNWNKISWNNGTIVGSEWEELQHFFAGNPYPKIGDSFAHVDVNLFLDINHDGLIDQLNFDASAANTTAGFVGLHQWINNSINDSNIELNAASKDKEKIINIEDAFGKNTEIEYDFMSSSDLYTPDDNSATEWFDEDVTLNRKSPVYDFNSSMSLVRSYIVDLPLYYYDTDGTIKYNHHNSGNNGDEAIGQEYQYQYFYGKLQAGGRGFLGFGQVNIYDLNKEISTKSIYRQDFPYIGQVERVETSRIKNDTDTQMLRMIYDNYSDSPCWVNGTCDSGIPEPILCPPTESTGCTANFRGDLADIAGNVISFVATTWDFNAIDTGGKTSYQTYTSEVLSENYELIIANDGVSNDIVGTSLTQTIYNELDGDFNYGNPTTIYEYSYPKDSFDEDNPDDNYAQRKTTQIDYCYFDLSTTAATDSDCVETSIQTDEYSVKPNQTVVTYTRPTEDENNPLEEIRTTDYKYDPSSRLLTDEILSAPNEAYELTKNHSNRDPFGNTEKITITSTNPNTIGNRNSEKYFDSAGRFVNESKVATETEQKVLSRNKFGGPTHTKNKQGISTFYSYDDFGKLFYQINELGQYSQIKYYVGQFSYVSDGQTRTCATGTTYYTETLSSGPTTWQCFDKLGREISTITQGLNLEEKSRVDNHYDSRGNLFEQSVPTFNTPSQWQRFEYDYIDRIVLSTNAKGQVTTTSYAPLEMSVKNAREDVLGETTTVKNILGEIISVEDAKGYITTYDYDAKGNQIKIDGPLPNYLENGIELGDIIRTEYDNFDQVTEINDPDLGVWTYKYNLFGELEYQRDAERNCTVMAYDDLGRLVTRKFWKSHIVDTKCQTPDSAKQSMWVYDPNSSSATYGLLTREYLFDGTFTKNYEYDSGSRVINVETVIEGISYEEKSHYDQHSRLLASVDATGGSVRYKYNEYGYQTQTIDQYIRTEDGENLVYNTINEIDAFGSLIKFTAGNGISTINGYDDLGRVTYTNSGNGIQILDYTYDSVGNLEKRIDTRNSADVFEEDYIYDDINRLTDVTATLGTLTHDTLTFTYDEGGRIETFNGNSYNYEGSGHIHGVNNIGSKQFDYDDNGNQEISDGRTLVYTAFNKVANMYKVVNPSISVQFEYDTNNARYKRIDRGADEYETTLYIGNVEIITNDNFATTKTKRYIADAVVTKDLDSNSEIINYLHKDHLGSIQVVTDANGYDTNHLSYDAFGRRREMNSNHTVLDYIIDENPIPDVTKDGFTGQEHIDQLGVINFNARLYDPSLGIMLQADTIIPDGPVTQSMNRYSYVFNNPLSYTDPTGHVPQDGRPNQLGGSFGDFENMIYSGFLTIGDQTGKQTFIYAASSIPSGAGDSVVDNVQNAAFDNQQAKMYGGEAQVEQSGEVQEAKPTEGITENPKGKKAKETFDIGDHVFSKRGETLKQFFERVAPRFIYLTKMNKAEIQSYLFEKNLKEGGEDFFIYALIIQTSGLPHFGAAGGYRPENYINTGKTIHTHAGKVPWTNALGKKTKAFINKHAKSETERKSLMQSHYYTPKSLGYFGSSGNGFSDPDFNNPGYLIQRGKIKYQEGKGTTIKFGEY